MNNNWFELLPIMIGFNSLQILISQKSGMYSNKPTRGNLYFAEKHV